ncbi:MAG: hypothetical protein Q7K57_25370 [Burkholderiaceae bacterium]|nr:hypothetical protein [Burkholderiaceae bacterium]
MELLALSVALVAIATSIISTLRASVRNEAQHQATLIQDLIKELSEASHRHCLSAPLLQKGDPDLLRAATSHEALCNLKCDLLESTLQLFTRRCASYLFFDANSEIFQSEFVEVLGRLRNEASYAAHNNERASESLYRINSILHNLYALVNEYIGERFRPIFERRI